MFRFPRRLLLSVAMLSLAAPALAAEAAQSTLKAKQSEITAIAKSDDAAKLDRAFDEILDYDALARDSLGEVWNERTPAEREEFQKLLTQLVRNAYRKSVKRTLGYAIEYKGESKLEDGVLVHTVAQSKANAREEPLAIDYAMHDAGGHWRIRDVVTDGSSLVRNYKNQFLRVVKQHGFAELLVRMRKKIAKGESA